MLPQIIFIIQQQFLQACSGNAHKFQLGFPGRARGHAAFGNVLLAASCRLHPLVMGAGSAVDELVAEDQGGAMNNLSHLIGLQGLVAAVGLNEARRGLLAGHGFPS